MLPDVSWLTEIFFSNLELIPDDEGIVDCVEHCVCAEKLAAMVEEVVVAEVKGVKVVVVSGRGEVVKEVVMSEAETRVVAGVDGAI